MKLTFIAAMGLVGIFARYFTDTYFSQDGFEKALNTFFINALGSMIAGVIFAFIQKFGQNLYSTALLTGFCGGFTTFSGYNLHFLILMNEQKMSKAFSLFLAGPIAGLTALFIGFLVTSKLLSLQNLS